MIKTLDLNRNITAYLENAFNVSYEKVSNQLWSASFSLPLNDPKNEKVKLLRYVEIDGVGLFRILPKKISKSSESITYTCEHVLSTLLGSTLFKYHQLSNYTTKEVLTYLLNQQKIKHWKIGTVEFTRYFHYSWENENLLSAIFSVPKPFDEQYRWTWDTSSYPWTLNLVKVDMEPTGRIQEGHNLINFEIEENPNSLWNRIYPLGAGEGVNQLTIESVNNGVPYIEDATSIAEYDLYETIWVDTRFTDAATLKANAEVLLKKWKEPIVSWTTTAADVSELTGTSVDELTEGKVIRVSTKEFGDIDLRILKESRPDAKGAPWNVNLELGNLTKDLGTTQTDLERRQKINEVYSQGATNIDSRDFQDNCDANYPAVIRFPIPNDVVNINEMKLTFETTKYRAYSKAIEGGGATAKSTASGGASTQTSSSGGGVVKSTASGGATTQTSSAGGDHDHVMFMRLGGQVTGTEEAYLCGGGIVSLLADSSTLRTASSSGDHTHVVNIPPHSHSFETPNHTHNVNIPAHTHDFTLPNHTHAILYGIFEYDELPTSVEITVDGKIIPHTDINGEDIDLEPYLQKDANGKISRGRFAEIKIKPNNLARINATVTSRLFIQSQIGGTF